MLFSPCIARSARAKKRVSDYVSWLWIIVDTQIHNEVRGPFTMNHNIAARRVLGSVFDMVAGMCAMLYAGIVLLWILASPYPALQDYLEWLYQGHVFAALVKANASAVAAFQMALYPIPNSLMQVMLGLLNLFLLPILAAKILLIIYLISFMVMLMLIARYVSLAHSGKLLLVLTTTTALNSSFWNGYINVQMSLLLFSIFFYLCYLKGHQGLAILFTFSLAIFFCHAITFAFLVGFLGIRETTLQPEKWLRWPRFKICAGILPALGLLLWYIVARGPSSATGVSPLPGKAIGDSFGAFLAYKLYTIMKQGAFHVFEFPDRTSHLASHDTLYWVGVALNGLFAVLLVAALLWGMWDVYRSKRWPDLRFLLPLVVCIGVPYFMLPQVFLGIVNFSERLLLPTLIVLFCLLPVRPAMFAALCVPVLTALPLTMVFLINPQILAHHNQGMYHRFFTHRPYQFAVKPEVFSSLGTHPYLPLDFETSVLFNRH